MAQPTTPYRTIAIVTGTSSATCNVCSRRPGLKRLQPKAVCCAMKRRSRFKAFLSVPAKCRRRSEKALHGLKKVANQADFGTNRRLNIDPPRDTQIQLVVY